MATLGRWAISAAGAAGVAALVRRLRDRPPAAPAAEPVAPPAPNPLAAGDPAQAIDAARQRLRREAEARGGGQDEAPG